MKFSVLIYNSVQHKKRKQTYIAC